jgi:hypothetical protein
MNSRRLIALFPKLKTNDYTKWELDVRFGSQADMVSFDNFVGER